MDLDAIDMLASGARSLAAPALSWTTTALYAALLVMVALLLRSRTRRGRMLDSVSRVLVWSAVILTLFALSVDHHTKISRSTLAGLRSFAHESGLYEYRRIAQLVLVIFTVAATFVLLRKLIRRGVRLAPGYRLFGFGIVALVGFVVVRELSLHQIDNVMGQHIASVSVGRLGEAGLLLAVASGAAKWVRHDAQAA